MEHKNPRLCLWKHHKIFLGFQYLTATIPKSTNQPSRNPPIPTCSGLPWSYKDTPSPRHYRAMHSIGVQGEHGLAERNSPAEFPANGRPGNVCRVIEFGVMFYRLKGELNVLNYPSRMIGESWHPFWLSLWWSLAE